MRSILLTLFLIIAIGTARAEVVRLAPDFTFPSAGNKTESLKSLRGMPVVLIIGKSPKSREIKQQVKLLRGLYEQFANKQVIFVLAFIGEPGPVKSDIPFVIANNGPAVAIAYGLVEKPSNKKIPVISNLVQSVSGGSDPFNIVIIGKDGNIDYQTSKVLPSQRVCDVIQNSYGVQSITGR